MLSIQNIFLTISGLIKKWFPLLFFLWSFSVAVHVYTEKLMYINLYFCHHIMTNATYFMNYRSSKESFINLHGMFYTHTLDHFMIIVISPRQTTFYMQYTITMRNTPSLIPSTFHCKEEEEVHLKEYIFSFISIHSSLRDVM